MDLATLFQAGIFLFAFLGFQVAVLNHLMAAKIAPIEKQLESHITKTEKKIENLRDGQAKLEKRFDGLESRFDGLESRFDGLEKKLDEALKNT